jgi:hypothetical protein
MPIACQTPIRQKAMVKNIKDYIEFHRRVEILWASDFEELELEEFPTTAFGGFAPWQVDEFLRVAKLHPEFHIVSCIEPELFVNRFVNGAMIYYLGQGDSDPNLVHDAYGKLDLLLLQTLNSGLRSSPA